MEDFSIDINIPISALKSPRISAALAELMLALGQQLATDAPWAEALSNAERSKAKRTSRTRSGSSHPPSEQARYDAFVAGLPELSQEFLALVEARGEVTITEVKEALGIKAPKALGGITGSITRWAPGKGVEVPYVASKRSGERLWTWTRGVPGASAVAAKPAQSAKKKKRSSGKRRKPRRPRNVDEFVDSMGGLSRQFMQILRSRGRLTRTEAIAQLGLSMPQALGGTVGAIGRKAAELGIQKPFTVQNAPNGERLFTWGAAPTESAEPTEPARPSAPAVRRRRKGETTASPVRS